MSQETQHAQTQAQTAPSNSNLDGTKGKGKERQLPLLPPGPSGSDSTPLSASATTPDPTAPEEGPIDPSTIDPAQWPFEPFPLPPPDGYWLPKFGPPPPPKFPSSLRNLPSATLPLFPPLMALTYPPPSPLSETDPTWLSQMVGDVQRQRSHLELDVAALEADVAHAHAESGLADGELAEEMDKMQAFLNMVASVAGNGFVRRMLEDVDAAVARLAGEDVYDDDDGEGDGEGDGEDDGNVEVNNLNGEDEDEDLYASGNSGGGHRVEDDADNADDEDSNDGGDEDDGEKNAGSPEESAFENDPMGGLAHPLSHGEKNEDRSEQSESRPEDDGASKEDAPLEEQPLQPPHTEVNVERNEEQPSLRDNAHAEPEADGIAKHEQQSPKTKEDIRGLSIHSEQVLAKLEEPLDGSITRRRSRAVGPRTRVPGIESSIDHGRERRKRSFLADEDDEDSGSDSGSDDSSRSKRAKISHEFSTPSHAGPSRKRSRESMESEEDELDELDSEEEVSNQVTPRPAREDSSLASVTGLKGKSKALAPREDGPSPGSPKRARTDVGPSTLAVETKEERVKWFEEIVAQASTTSTSRQLVLYGGASASSPASASASASSSWDEELASLPPRLPRHLAPSPPPPASRRPSPPIPSLGATFRAPYPQGQSRALRRETEHLRQNATGQAETYHVHDVRGREPSPSPPPPPPQPQPPRRGRPLRRETERLRGNAFGEPEVYHVYNLRGREDV
ncbi:hypothetical protein PAXINDRAFT_156452 [Paxillus involutus ATCC 200175]|uniref:Uncharacterized protein n=1 Tax=Paxillus involutus ATCC 200175 TaxID=664439 RepID=A0A0C9TTT8_PAXIN|nr:hypothetical protein PAXINDRAFT_156452 [Paxillus involutus ATCC 200175]